MKKKQKAHEVALRKKDDALKKPTPMLIEQSLVSVRNYQQIL